MFTREQSSREIVIETGDRKFAVYYPELELRESYSFESNVENSHSWIVILNVMSIHEKYARGRFEIVLSSSGRVSLEYELRKLLLLMDIVLRIIPITLPDW